MGLIGYPSLAPSYSLQDCRLAGLSLCKAESRIRKMHDRAARRRQVLARLAVPFYVAP